MPPGGAAVDWTASNNLTVSERARRRQRAGASDPYAMEREQVERVERVHLDETAEQRRARRRARQDCQVASPSAQDELEGMMGREGRADA